LNFTPTRPSCRHARTQWRVTPSRVRSNSAGKGISSESKRPAPAGEKSRTMHPTRTCPLGQIMPSTPSRNGCRGFFRRSMPGCMGKQSGRDDVRRRLQRRTRLCEMHEYHRMFRRDAMRRDREYQRACRVSQHSAGCIPLTPLCPHGPKAPSPRLGLSFLPDERRQGAFGIEANDRRHLLRSPPKRTRPSSQQPRSLIVPESVTVAGRNRDRNPEVR
jgi:hypothetical protein